ncbi:MAG: ABC transporter substrate-binding protein [Solirubrobacteraceae bacterium]|nr:ABC transporter substrate-binding protein [Solirubrobacteraceae bacterium]
MRRISPRLAAILAASALLGFAGCGGDDDSSDSGGETTAAKSGGNATAYYTSFPDYLDPALSYTVEGWQALWVSYTPLLTYPHKEGVDGAKLIPGLAEDMPEISADGKTFTLTLRKGLKYSDGSAVKASDFEHAIQRVLNLESGGSAFYQEIVGAEDYLKANKASADISGIETDDATGEISIELTKPDGQFPFALAMPFASLVPGDTPFSNQTKTPPPGVGAFEISEVDGTKSFTLTKNPNKPDIEGVPGGQLDSLKITVVKSAARQGQDVLDNKVDYILDPPVAEQLREAKSTAADRFKEITTNSTYYMFLNTQEAPFDKKEVRQAVNFGLNKPAIARLFSGLMSPTCNFLPPNMQGFEKLDPCPYGDPNGEPDIAKAKQLVEQAGATGAKVTVWGNDEDETRQVTVALADQLKAIGLDARPRIVEGSVYFQTIGNQKTKAQGGFANWFQDFPHPGNFMFLVDGASIQETNNQNFGNVNDPVINDTLAKINQNPDLAAVAPEYAKLDKRLVDEALVAPYGNRKLTLLTSDRMAFDQILWHPLYNADYTTFALK